jgi:hypothetical protein
MLINYVYGGREEGRGGNSAIANANAKSPMFHANCCIFADSPIAYEGK